MRAPASASTMHGPASWLKPLTQAGCVLRAQPTNWGISGMHRDFDPRALLGRKVERAEA